MTIISYICYSFFSACIFYKILKMTNPSCNNKQRNIFLSVIVSIEFIGNFLDKPLMVLLSFIFIFIFSFFVLKSSVQVALFTSLFSIFYLMFFGFLFYNTLAMTNIFNSYIQSMLSTLLLYITTMILQNALGKKKSYDLFFNKSFSIYLIFLNGLFAIMLIIFVIHSINIELNTSNSLQLLFIIIFCLSMLVILSITVIIYNKKKATEEIRKMELINLKEYTEQIEEMYDEIRIFRHDYINIIRSLDISIESQNINEIKQIYNSVIKPSAENLRNIDFTLAKLINMKIPEIKSLLIAKTNLAHTKGIDIVIEIEQEFIEIAIDTLHIYRILAILLDNSIEAAEKCEIPRIMITFIQTKDINEQIIIISNTIPEKKIKTSNLGGKNVSSKGKNRGLGLYAVNELIGSYPYVSLDTQSINYLFTQKISIMKAKK